MLDSLVAVVITLSVAAGAPAERTERDRSKELRALRAVHAVWPAYAAADNPYAPIVGAAVKAVVFELAGIAPDASAEQQKAALLPLLADLNDDGIDGVALLQAQVPQLESARCSIRQSEAQRALASILAVAQDAREKRKQYSRDLDPMGFGPARPADQRATAAGRRYDFAIVEASTTTFLARAVGIGDMAGDEWTINEKNELRHTKSFCPPPPTPANAVRIDRASRLRAAGQLAALATPGAPSAALLGNGVRAILLELASARPDLPPAEQVTAIAPVLGELAAAGFDGGAALVPVLDGVAPLLCPARQQEATSLLKELYVLEVSQRAETDTYTKDLDTLGLRPRSERQRYRAEVVTASATTLLLRATGTGDMAGDEWTIDENMQLQNTRSVCTPAPSSTGGASATKKKLR